MLLVFRDRRINRILRSRCFFNFVPGTGGANLFMFIVLVSPGLRSLDAQSCFSGRFDIVALLLRDFLTLTAP